MLRRAFLGAVGGIAALFSTAKGGVRTGLKFGDKVRVTIPKLEQYYVPGNNKHYVLESSTEMILVGFITFIDDASHLLIQSLDCLKCPYVYEFHRRITDSQKRWYFGGDKTEREVKVEILDRD